MMVRVALLAAALLGPQSLGAQCAPEEQVFVACKIEGRKTEMSVCYTPDTATYRYGPVGKQPDLVLSTPMIELEYRPWAGVGSTIWESVAFINKNYRYEVGAGVPRLFSAEDIRNPPQPYASVSVDKDETNIATLDCTTESLIYDNSEALFTAKEALGLKWDHDVFAWVRR